MKTRKEKDALGTVEVSAESYGGSFYTRAFNNFKISNLRAYPSFANALCMIKIAAAKVNADLGHLDKKKSEAVQKAGKEFLEGKFGEFFDLDIYQAGAGTPFNMTMNEILANRATEILGGKKGEYLVHPNDHVNMSQSSNDVIPTAIRIAAIMDLERFFKEADLLAKSLEKKSKEFKDYLKVGRTHLQDAVPITLGQEFGAYASALRGCIERAAHAKLELSVLGIGGTAIGSGINTHKDFAKKICKELSKLSDLDFAPAENKFETTHSMAAMLSVSSSLRSLAVELLRISNDLRLMASGPIAGFNDILLPEVEPGSSIMPGKVNPSVPECMSMICIQVIGLDQTICMAAQQGQFELNWHTPLIMTDLLHQIEILTNGMKMFREHCIDGIKADKEKLEETLCASTALATALAPYIGYHKVAEMVQESLKKKVPFRKLVPKKYQHLIDAESMTKANRK